MAFGYWEISAKLAGVQLQLKSVFRGEGRIERVALEEEPTEAWRCNSLALPGNTGGGAIPSCRLQHNAVFLDASEVQQAQQLLKAPQLKFMPRRKAIDSSDLPVEAWQLALDTRNTSVGTLSQSFALRV